jgi:hypothetical protein
MITPSFNLTATERVLPNMALDFITAALDSRVTFTRAGNTATVIDSTGNVVGINADLPRFDFNSVALVCKGLLIEESRTNLFLPSNDFSSVSWSLTSTDLTVTQDSTLSPQGTANAYNLAFASNAAAALFSSLVTVSAGTNYTGSVFLKKGNSDLVLVRCGRSVTFSNGFGVYVNLATGQAGGTFQNGSGTVYVSHSITELKNGWYRVSVTGSISTTSMAMSVVNTTNSSGTTITRNLNTNTYAYGAQIEAGAFPTSYIPTVASQVTRTADVATMTGTNFSDWYNAGAGGVAARVLPSTVSGIRPLVQFDDNTANEIIALRGNTTNPELQIIDGGTPQAAIDAGTIAANTVYNLGTAWNTDDCAVAVNGGAAVTDTSATIPTVTQARLGSDGTNYLNGHLQAVRYWPQRIINAEVQAFSK